MNGAESSGSARRQQALEDYVYPKVASSVETDALRGTRSPLQVDPANPWGVLHATMDLAPEAPPKRTPIEVAKTIAARRNMEAAIKDHEDAQR